jgi:serine/threonine-protein kinase
MRAGPRDLGQLVARTFDSERTVIAQTIEAQLASRVTAIELREPLPLLCDPVSHTGDPVTPTEPTLVPVGLVGTPTTGISLLSAAPPSEPPPMPSLRSRRRVLTVGCVLLASALVVGRYWVRERSRAPIAADAAASPAVPSAMQPPPSAAPAPAPAPAAIELSINATPNDARIFIDDKAVSGNPYRGKLPKDSATHQIRVEASGFQTVKRSITLDKDLAVEVALRKETERATRVMAPPPPPPDDDFMKRPPVKTNRNVDMNNPYAN